MIRRTRLPLGARTGTRRGAVLPLVCVLLTVLVGAAALAIDLGQLYYAGIEVQTAADAAALGTTRMKQWYPYAATTSLLQVYANQTAALNRAAGQAVTVNAADVVPKAYNPTTRAFTSVNWSENTTAIQVTAQVRVPSLLRGLLGDSARIVRRTATAWVANVNGMNCVRPLSINYTRFYEEGVSHDNRYTQPADGSPPTNAPDFVQWDISNTQYPPLDQRTFIFLPPDLKESDYDNATFTANGNWRPVDYAGGSIPAFTSATGAAVGSAECAPLTQLGDIEQALPTATPTQMQEVVDAATAGMAQLCHRSGTADDAHCYDAQGNVGVRARLLFSDSIALANGSYQLKVREVGVVRIMCYFTSTADVCGDVPMNEPLATGTWTVPFNKQRYGYPRGTIALFFDCPGTADITSDMVLGTKPSITQRLMLVK